MEQTKIKAAGEIRLDLGLIYYPLGDYWYAVNSNNLKYIVQAQPVLEEQSDKEKQQKKKAKVKYWLLKLNDIESYIFEDAPIGRDMPYNNPITRDMASYWFEEKCNPTIDEIYLDIKRVLKQCYDFSDDRDLDVAILFILQSWFSDILKGVFYVDVRSQMGGGKTILLELMQGLSRYGILANDMSFAVIPRMVDRYKCTLFFDEIDMINKHVIEDIFKILRTGYRKGQKYIRAKPKTFEPETFDCYGAKAFNYRSDVADDLKNRSLPINTSKSHDKTLPILNLYKETFLKPIAFKIFCFYMNSLSRLLEVDKIFKEDMARLTGVNEVNKVNGLMVNTNTDNNNIYPPSRNHFLSCITHFYQQAITLNFGLIGSNMPKNDKKPHFNPVNPVNFSNLNPHLMRDFTEKETIEHFSKLMEKLTGRSIELFSLVIHLCSSLGLDIFQNFKELLEEKAEFEDHDEEDLKNVLREILIEQEVGAGIHKGMNTKFRYYRDIQSEFMKKVYESYGYKPTTNYMKRYLRELGFVDKKNKKVLKFGDDTALCLLYDDAIKKNLGLPV